MRSGMTQTNGSPEFPGRFSADHSVCYSGIKYYDCVLILQLLT